MLILKESTATQNVPLGPIVAASDGTTAYTSSILNTEIKITKHNATSEVSKNSGNSTHISGGRHYAVFDATDTNTVGRFKVTVVVASQLQWWDNGFVYPASVYDALIAGTIYHQVNVVNINSDSTAPQALQKFCSTFVFGNAVTGTLSTTQATTNLGSTYATNDQLKGRRLIWEGNVTAALAGQSTIVSSYVGSTKMLTFDTMTTAPANLDRFIIAAE